VGQRLAGLWRSALFYGWWYPTRWVGWSFWPKYGEYGALAKHVRFVERASRRLARGVFHSMISFGPKLEQRQSVLFRLVDVGAELFAMSASCARVQMLKKKDPSSGVRAERLADLFCRQARERIRVKFQEMWNSADVPTYRTAQEVLKGEHLWLEKGLV